jgi:hypothetical protein
MDEDNDDLDNEYLIEGVFISLEDFRECQQILFDAGYVLTEDDDGMVGLFPLAKKGEC